MAANTYDVRTAVQRLARALLDDVERIAGRSVARMQELLPSYAQVPAEALIPVTLTNTRNLLEAVCGPNADSSRADDHFRVSGETRLGQGITADEMLEAWRIGLEVVREEAHPVAKRLEVTDAVLLEFVEATLQWGDVGMRRSAEAYRRIETGELERLAAEQAALRRVAEMIARQASAEEVFAVVAEELSRVFGVSAVRTVRFEPDGTATVQAARGLAEDLIPPGTTNLHLPRGTVIEQVLRTGRPARGEDFTHVDGPIGELLREEGVRCAVGGPIIVDGRLWGAMAVGAQTADALPPGSEDRVARFAELVSTAISNIEARSKVERLAAEQSALRRVAELVARQAPPEEVFGQVTGELSRLLDVNMVRTVRFEHDGTATILAARGSADDRLTEGANFAIPEGSSIGTVLRTGRPARVDDFAEVKGPIGAALREHGVGAGVAGPIKVGGRLWGAMAVGARNAEALPPGSEHRVAQFAELISTAISNVESRTEVEQLAAEQAALRRVAELVAQQASAEQVFALVTEELSRLLDVATVGTGRFEPDGTVTIMAVRGTAQDAFPPGTSVALEGGSAIEQVYRTGCPAHVENYDSVGGQLGSVMRKLGAGWAAAGPIVVDGRLWGAMTVNSGSAGAYPPGAEERVAQFTELVSTAISNLESRAKVEQLAAEQAALRRVAELVARQAPAEQVFAVVTEELSHVLGADLMVRTAKFEPDGTATILAARGTPSDLLPAGTNTTRPGGGILDQVLRTGRPGRVDDYTKVTGPVAASVRNHGIRAAAAGPIVVEGRTWGAMAVGSQSSLPPGIEHRVTQFAEHVSTAISNIESRAKVERLAAEQSALRRVATLVAREHSPEDLFAILVEELGILLGVDATAILRYDADSSATVVAGWSDGTITLPVGERLPLEGENLAGEVHRTGSPRRKEDYSGAPGVIAATVRQLGIRSAVASPIVVEGATWGVIAVLSRQPDPLPSDTEARIAEFTHQAALAVANAKSRSDLAESRARIVRAGDDARRRFERDLHDGAQQRLVSLGLELRSAEATLPSDLGDLRARLSGVAAGLNGVLDDLRELSRGLHPAVLSEDGLTPALSSLARRSAVPVDLRLDLGTERFEEPVEVAAYYVASEALTNTAKHAGASRVAVTAMRREGWLELSVRDDGLGGADVSSGSGLTGLIDRVEAIGGTMHIDSRSGLGTAVHVKLPIKSTSV
jgi:GAF domain-containing protein